MNLQEPIKETKSPPEQVLDAAAACFMEKGYGGASLDDVARHMGATKGRIYHYFSSKSDLMHAVRKRAMELNFAVIRPGFDSDLPPVEKFRAMAHAHALHMMERQDYQTALFDSLHLHMTRGTSTGQDALVDDFITDRRAFEDMFREVLLAGQASGEFAFGTLSYALHTILATLNSTLYWYSPRNGDTPEIRQQIADEQVAMALRALGAMDPMTKDKT